MADLSKGSQSQEPQDATPVATEEVVRVGDLGSSQDITFVEGRGIAYYLNCAGITVRRGQGITLNGQKADRDTVVTSSPKRTNVIVVAGRPKLG